MQISSTGPINPSSAGYVARPFDEELFSAVSRSEYVNLRGGRQTGKTSSLLRLRARLLKAGYATSYVDISQCSQFSGEAEWLDCFCETLVRLASPPPKSIDTRRFPRRIPQLQSFLYGLVRELNLNTVIIVDEVNTIPEQIRKRVFTALRVLYNERADVQAPDASRKLTFVFAGTFDPETLIRGDNSPFNIARDIVTTNHDFSKEQVEAICTQYELPEILEAIANETSGHPYLVARLIELCQGGLGVGEAITELTNSDVHFRNLGSSVRSLGEAGEAVLSSLFAGDEVPCGTGLDVTVDALSALGILKCRDGERLGFRCKIYEAFLDNLLKRMAILKGTEAELIVSPTAGVVKEASGTDVLIITALEEELAALLALFPDHKEIRDGSKIYYRFSIQGSYNKAVYEVVALCLRSMGGIQAALWTQTAITVWKPLRYILLGIAAGYKKTEIQLGDVLIAEQIVGYEIGSQTAAGHKPRFQVYKPPADLLTAAKALGDNWQIGITCRPPTSAKTVRAPKAHAGEVASGDKIVRSTDFVEKLAQQWPKFIGIEMEGVGVAAAADEANAPGVLLVKAVSDWADEEKNDLWRQYACESAACFTKALIQSEPFLSRSAS